MNWTSHQNPLSKWHNELENVITRGFVWNILLINYKGFKFLFERRHYFRIFNISPFKGTGQLSWLWRNWRNYFTLSWHSFWCPINYRRCLIDEKFHKISYFVTRFQLFFIFDIWYQVWERAGSEVSSGDAEGFSPAG